MFDTTQKLVTGDVIGGIYEVKDFLGEGGYSEVYLVCSKQIKQLLALKTINEKGIIDPIRRARIKQEASIWVKLGKHPYIVQLMVVDEIDGRLWIGLEPIINEENKDLSTLEGYLNGNINFDQVLSWAIQFCIGIEYAYSQGLKAHRDIKPSNIMITKDEKLKITDFGISGILTLSLQNEISDDQNPKLTQKLIGTKTHMSPEQFDNPSECDERSDIYSFGIVLYQMVNRGKTPFCHGGWDEMERQHKECPVPPFNSELFPIISRCLEKDPQKRYQTFKELHSEIASILKKKAGEIIETPTSFTYEINEFINWALCFSNLGFQIEAIERLDRALEIDGKNVTALLAKGVCLIELHEYTEAIPVLTTVTEIDPTNSQALSHIIVCYYNLGEYEKVEPFFLEHYEQLRKFPDSIHNIGILYQKSGSHEKALSFFDESLKNKPIEPSKILFSKGVSLMALKRYEEAIECFKSAIKLNPTYIEAYQNRGLCYAYFNPPKMTEAIKCFDFITEQYAKYPDPRFVDEVAKAWNDKGVCYLRLKKYDEAINCFEKAYLLGNTIISSNNKAEALFYQGKFDSSNDLFKEVLRRLPELENDTERQSFEKRIQGFIQKMPLS